jgi:hypothetical protein
MKFGRQVIANIQEDLDVRTFNPIASFIRCVLLKTAHEHEYMDRSSALTFDFVHFVRYKTAQYTLASLNAAPPATLHHPSCAAT